MASGSRSPPSVSAPFQGERSVVSRRPLVIRRSWSCRRQRAPRGGRARPAKLCGAAARRCATNRRLAVQHRLPPLSGVRSRRTCMGSVCVVSRKVITARTAQLILSAGSRGMSPHSARGCTSRSRRRSYARRSLPRPPGLGRRLSCDKERKLLEPRQSAPCALLTSIAPSPPPVPSYLPEVTTPSEVCIIQRSASLDDLERRLQLAVVAYVGGTRPPVSCEDATVMLAAQLDIPRYRFSVQKYFPEDFLVVFASHESRNRAPTRQVVVHQGIQLHIKPWPRQAQATARSMHVQADILIEGVPSHAWTKDTAAKLLDSSCLIDSLASETENHEDLSLIKLRV
ncbi:hypothetical protein ZWY2020_053220 [Hordeum vulgare]|nr:hypothetical protein ZWY2020_053220 [Hordeum vulgare]